MPDGRPPGSGLFLEELESEDFRADPEVEELELEWNPWI